MYVVALQSALHVSTQQFQFVHVVALHNYFAQFAGINLLLSIAALRRTLCVSFSGGIYLCQGWSFLAAPGKEKWIGRRHVDHETTPFKAVFVRNVGFSQGLSRPYDPLIKRETYRQA